MDVNTLEVVQRKFTALILGMGGLSYAEMSDKLHLILAGIHKSKRRLDQTNKFWRYLDWMDVGNLKHRVCLKIGPFEAKMRLFFVLLKSIFLKE